MKIDELMIGNWVLVNGTPMQIQAINDIDGEIMAGDELYCLVEDRVHSEDKIEPIPLTAEILEKNGWYVPQAKIWWECYNVSFWLAQFVDGRFKIMTDEDSDCVFAAIRYVHELQHILRLCGINKEIVL